jgi:hypothetical protein
LLTEFPKEQERMEKERKIMKILVNNGHLFLHKGGRIVSPPIQGKGDDSVCRKNDYEKLIMYKF